MDEESWLFFCNNSPKLVQRSKSPVILCFAKAKVEVPGLALSKLHQSKSNLRPAESASARKIDLCKITIRSINKEQSEILRQSKSGSKLDEKQNKSPKETNSYKRNVPLAPFAKKPFLSKRLNFLYKRNLMRNN